MITICFMYWATGAVLETLQSLCVWEVGGPGYDDQCKLIIITYLALLQYYLIIKMRENSNYFPGNIVEL